MQRLACSLTLVIGLMLASACGPVEDPNGCCGGGNGMVDAAPAFDGDPAGVTGTVWAPGQTPGQVPPGHEIPIFNALITLSTAPLPPIPQETYCERCVNPAGTYAFSDHQGNFTISGVIPNTYWLTVQKGQFRTQRQVVLGEGQTLDLPAELTTLPSVHDPGNGQWIPRIAMAVGQYDHLEDILGKMGLGEVDGSGRYVGNSAAGVMDVYTNGASFSGPVSGSFDDLVTDLNRLLQYHIIFIPCSYDTYTHTLGNQQTLRNIRDFVDAGGKLYVTDWSGEWSDNVFPAQITLGESAFRGPTDTRADAYDPATNTWNTNAFGNADGDAYDSNNAEIVDADLYEWMRTQSGPIVEDYAATTPYDPQRFTVEGNWNDIDALNMVYLGDNDEGMSIYDVPRSYIIGGHEFNTPKRPLTVTYEPTGCGRVLFSTYHTTDNTHNGLVPQERVLLYLIMEIGVCQSGPIIE